MELADFTERKSGRLVRHQRGYWAFVPDRLPPPIESTWELAGQISAADSGLGELSGICRTLPNPQLLIRPFMSREAVLSSRIEGTEASLSDLFYFEADPKTRGNESDVREVSQYVRALEHGLKRLPDFPMSLRLIREIHQKLMRGVRGEHLTPGEFRRSQNWIGPSNCTLNEATFVPPPHEDMMDTLGDLEKFIHEPSPMPFVVRLALIHYQFEAIHPFLDGNGRIGRLLIPLLLYREGLLPQPILYASAYFERHRNEYYRLLLAVSQDGRWSEWISFFLRGLAEQARDAVKRSGQLLALWKDYRARMQSVRASALPLKLVDELFDLPLLTFGRACKMLGVTYRAAQLNVRKLVSAGIIKPIPKKAYGQVFLANEILDILEPPSERSTTAQSAEQEAAAKTLAAPAVG